jgi:hypothetical protein
MTVAFAELGSHVTHKLGVARGSRGTIAFAPADGPAGTRRIVALVTQDGQPRPQVALTTYRAPGPLRPGRAPRLRVALRRHTLKVSFGAARNALRYQVRISSTDGKHRVVLASKGHRSARLAGFGPGAKVTVRVIAYAANGRAGPAAVARA